ncbi:MAG: DUF2723 domain-containing protein [Candidatus Marinimicrobia bacterium]|nr:DUF2723 domain-containing protein [Candidatus Neomarinimicrobiota bacterium]
MFNQIRETDRVQFYVATGVLLVSLLTYFKTVAPTVSFWDCGEYIATAFTLGVPHPPGAPFFLILARLFTMLPIGEDIAYRVNLLSVISSALTVMFTFLIIVKLIRQWRGKIVTFEDKLVTYTGGVIGALSFAWSDSFWFNAVEAEVYALSMLFTAAVVWLALHWLEHEEEGGASHYLLMIAYLMGLALGVHLLSLLTLPVVALIIYFKKFKTTLKSFLAVMTITGLVFIFIYLGIVKGLPGLAHLFSFKAVFAAIALLFIFTYYSIKNNKKIIALSLMSAVLVTIGYSTYTLIYVRANAAPTINENNPSTTQSLVSYLNRDQYGDAPIFDRKRWKPRMAGKYTGVEDYFWNYQIKRMYVRYFSWQFIGRGISEVDITKFYALPFLLGLFGAFYHYRKDPKQSFNILTLFFMTGLAIVLYLNQEDPQPRERDYSYVGSFMAYSIWIGIGATGLLELLLKKITGWRSNKYLPATMAALIFLTVPFNMMVKGYNEHDRSGNYVAWDYSYNILATTEPNAIIFTNGDNDTFPVWYLQEVEGIRKDVKVVNLSLLNTPWYIKQLRDYEPKINITLSDKQIEEMSLRSWPREGMKVSIPGEPDASGNVTNMEWHVKPTVKTERYAALRIQDMMILHILEKNKWKRPIYFAVTVSPDNKIGLERYLRMDGLAFKIIASSPIAVNSDGTAKTQEALYPELINTSKIEENLIKNYRYKNLNNPDVYLNPNVKKLLQNYRSAFLQLGYKYMMEGKKENLSSLLNSMEEIMPESVIPVTNKMAQLQIGVMEREAGFPEKMRERLDKLLSYVNNTFNDKLIYGSYYMRELKDYKTASTIFEELVVEKPNSGRAVGLLVTAYELDENYLSAVEVLREWLVNFPADNNALQRMQEIRALADAPLNDDSKENE